VTATYMGGRRGPPEGDERPLRGLPGGRARPRPSPPETPPPGNGDRPGQGGSGGVVRPLRAIPGRTAPPLRVIPGGAEPPSDPRPDHAGSPTDATGAPLELVEAPLDPAGVPEGLAGRDGHVAAGRPGAGGRRRGVSRGRLVAAVLVRAVLAGLGVTGRVVAERPRASATSGAPATTAAPATSGAPGATVRSSPVVATIGTGGFSSGMAAGAGALWVVGSDQISRVDPATDSVTATIPVGGTGSGPDGVAVGAGAVWVPVAVPGALWGIDPETDKVTSKISLDGPLRGTIAVAATRDSVWVACCGAPSGDTQGAGGRLLRVDPRRKRVVTDIPLPAVPVAIAADSSAAWVATADGQVLQVSQKRQRVTATIDAGGPLGFSQTIAVGPGGVWLADAFDEQIVRIDPKSRRVMARIPAGAATTLAVTGDAVWALSSLGLLRIDPAQDRVVAVAPDPDLRRARLLAAGAGAVWTAAWSSVSRIDPELVTP
jgi:YVTN family beta-propeller protein